MIQPQSITAIRYAIPALIWTLLLTFAASVPSGACTSFCLDTPGGTYLAANLDLGGTGDGHLFINRRGIAKKGYYASTTGETARWISRYGNVTFNLVGRELPWSGMNEAGLTMSTMQLTASRCPDPDERPPFSEGSIVQYVLDTCGSVEEAIEAVSQVRLNPKECTSHYMVVDSSGDCATIEFLDGRLVCHTGENLPVRALANAPYVYGVTYIEQGIVPEYNPGRSVQRVADAAERARRFNPDNGVGPVEYALDVLTRTVVDERFWWDDWFDEPYTRWSVVFDIKRQAIHYRTVVSPKVKRLRLSSFDFSCEAPMLMLDVNTDRAGNIDRSFHHYDHKANLEIFRSFCRMWGIDVSDQGSLELVRLFESFECAKEND